MKKLLFIIVFITVFSLIFSGCGLIQPSITATGNQVLNLSDIDPITLDPAVAGEVTSHRYIVQIFSGLLKTDDALEPIPDIAEDMPEISQDGITYTFHIRKNAKFHNGKEVTADDFKYSWERAAKPSTGSRTAIIYLGDIVGVKEMLAGKDNSISGVKVLDKYTLQVTIDSPKSYFLSKMTYPTSFVVDLDNVSSGKNWWLNPNGTGPFVLVEWDKGSSLILKRNQSYHGAIANIEEVRYQFYTGLDMDLYETDQIDVTGVSLNYIDKVMDEKGPFFNDLVVTPEFSFYYIGFNCSKPPFDDANIRKAFSMAIDRDKITSLVFRSMVEKANGLVPPGMPGYNDKVTGIEFNVNRAKELINQSKYGDISKLPTITLTTSGYGGEVGNTLQAIVYQWKENLGVDVKIRQLEPERLIYNMKAEINEMYDMGWVADYPHPQDFLDILFRSGAENNYGSYSNKQADELIDQANRTLVNDQSFKLYNQAEQIIVDDAACIPISFGKNYTLIKPYVSGYALNPLGYSELSSVIITPN